MTPVAFFAPLKPPTHANPSGDRALARAVMEALRHAGFEPDLASDLRLLDLVGDATQQNDLIAQADAALPDLIAQGRRAGWQMWVCYHNYYKAPDLLGPHVARALGIPYVQIESTRAQKRLTGPWAQFAKAAEAAANAADVIFYFTERDSLALKKHAPTTQQLVHLRPFLTSTSLPPASDRSGAILSAGMMRPGDKLESYRLIAETLALIDGDSRLEIAGDGTARSQVEDMMQPFGDRVRFLGQLDADGMADAYSTARAVFWPGVNEAIGLTYLEAQAAGVPVLAQNRPGLREVMAPTLTLPAISEGASGLARALNTLLDNPPPSKPLREHIKAHHLLPAAATTLRDTLRPLLEQRT